MTNDQGAGAADAAGAATAGGEQMTVESALLGEIVVPEGSLFTIPAGLLGLERYTRFALVPAGRDGVFWLQSAEEPGLAFVLADPFRLVAGYSAELPDADVAAIGAERPEDVMLLAVVTLPGEGRGMTANLRAPLALNVATRVGRQVVLPDDRYGTAEPVQL
jgi:flagellar assembly factor FliW